MRRVRVPSALAITAPSPCCLLRPVHASHPTRRWEYIVQLGTPRSARLRRHRLPGTRFSEVFYCRMCMLTAARPGRTPSSLSAGSLSSSAYIVVWTLHSSGIPMLCRGRRLGPQNRSAEIGGFGRGFEDSGWWRWTCVVVKRPRPKYSASVSTHRKATETKNSLPDTRVAVKACEQSFFPHRDVDISDRDVDKLRVIFSCPEQRYCSKTTVQALLPHSQLHCRCNRGFRDCTA